MRNNGGFTLVELIIAMALFITVIMISASAFESIRKISGKVVASEESNIAGVVGLEMFRYDLHQMGFGLPSAFKVAPTYAEVGTDPDPREINDSPSGVPRAVASWENASDYGDYLAIKASSVGQPAAKTYQKWTYVTYSSSTQGIIKKWPKSTDNLDTSNKVVIIDRTFTKEGKQVNTLVNSTATDWNSYTIASAIPQERSQLFYVYGIDNSTLRMPFNRVDYYVKRPTLPSNIPARCAANTGILYKTAVTHSAGELTPENPLIDCVADMQVVFGWDVYGDGNITESSAYDSDSTKISVSGTAGQTEIQTIMKSSEEIRNKLKYIKVYLMVQEGNKDMGYTNSSKIVVGDVESITKGYDVAALTAKGWLNYRWKIYRLVLRPKNI